ncbi:uncharacterized protein BCR38DRAFT_427503 [Pseudomassariella vexata]|uniref:Rieske domain-containing protein n=1 Tax=Pseudomassariella vexata TaxID=1141098 RepID=A0A1Y2E7N6_9PEZI|nr:uncharacterized protein BCR38DRAFT_427503 [Pseudomassariella vexata]ORY67571.1 hypothetical protein BCR38DRAFT_427503 [Pseudomassariella vexata]
MAASFFSAFKAPSRSGSAWFSVGLASSFPDITESGSTAISQRLPCKSSSVPGCKVFRVSRNDSSSATEVPLDDVQDPELGGLKDQVLVFQYKGKFHAVNNECPHASYPLSNGTPFDIEDFGINLSSGLTCPKHGWSFDLFRGNGDRGNYRLAVWEVQLRPVTSNTAIACTESTSEDDPVEEVWVRRKQRMG